MPKQISSKKETPVVIKSILPTEDSIHENINIVKNSSKKVLVCTTKPDPSSLDKIPNRSSVKKNITIEEKSSNYDDRVLAYEITRSKSKKTLSKPNSNMNLNIVPDNWICDNCTNVNKPFEYKCHGKNINNNLECKKQNIHQREVLDTVVSPTNAINLQPKSSHQSIQYNTNSHHSSMKSPSKDKLTPPLEKKNTEKKLTTYINEKKSCICYTNYNESVIKNNICTLCNRYVENVKTTENSIKKRYQQQESNCTNNSNRPSSTLTKKQESMNKITENVKSKKEELIREAGSHASQLNNKFRSPSSNISNVKPRSTTLNRYKDIYIEDEEVVLGNNHNHTNPFGKAQVSESNYRSNQANNSNVMNNRVNTAKKKSESSHHTINVSNPTTTSTLTRTRK